jgi:predicted nucleic acid-binding protein
LTPVGVTRIAVDTAAFIYFIERHPTYLPFVKPYFLSADRGDIEILTTILTLAEVLVKPLRLKRRDLVVDYTDLLLQTPNISVIAVSADIAEEAAQIRADLKFKLPDAIQLATAVRMGASAFLTNDIALSAYKSVQILQLDRLAGLP